MACQFIDLPCNYLPSCLLTCSLPSYVWAVSWLSQQRPFPLLLTAHLFISANGLMTWEALSYYPVLAVLTCNLDIIVRMLSLFSKSSRQLETSPVCHNNDTRSLVGARHVSRERRHVSRGRHVSQLRALFSSDVEEVTSVVSDNPGLYTRSTSMSGINGGANVRAKKNLLR